MALPYGCSAGLVSRSRHSWPIFIPGHRVIGRFATLDSSRVMWPVNPGSMNPAVEWVSSPRRPSDDLPSSRPARSSGSEHRSSVAPRTNSPGCEHERLALLRLDEGGQVVLAHRRVDVGVAGVVEDAEQVVQPDIDARRLDQAFLERIDAKSSRGDFGTDVAIGEQHATSVAAEVLAFVITGVSQIGRCSSMAEHQLPKLNTRVRFPSSAPRNRRSGRLTPRPSGPVVPYRSRTPLHERQGHSCAKLLTGK